ncbi:unnamed protein product, partial [Iphiclides podalirius]
MTTLGNNCAYRKSEQSSEGVSLARVSLRAERCVRSVSGTAALERCGLASVVSGEPARAQTVHEHATHPPYSGLNRARTERAALSPLVL